MAPPIPSFPQQKLLRFPDAQHGRFSGDFQPRDGNAPRGVGLDVSTGRAERPSQRFTRGHPPYVQEGATLIVHRAAPKHQAWLESLTGRKVAVEVQPYQAWVDRQMLQRRDGLVTGLDNLDPYWRTQTSGEGPQDHWQVSCGVEKGQERRQVQYVVKVEGAADYFFPGGLVEIQLHNGRIVIDQLKWEASAKDMICGSPTCCLSALLTLGSTGHLGRARSLRSVGSPGPLPLSCHAGPEALAALSAFFRPQAGRPDGHMVRH
jgi:hypothetical protein